MSELTQSVVVCNREGRVLLYNRRAKVQFRALSDAPASAGGAELVGAGHRRPAPGAIGWETEPMQAGDETGASELTVRDVVERHDGAFWFERERVRHEAFFRFVLPQAADRDPPDAAPGARDLAELSYTVFDTETTGLDPARSDEIVQIGATRIVAGKLRRQETFEQLVDPGREIPEASIAIHGIRPEMVAGRPRIDAVLPAFHAFARDTVLVAHNAAFDLRFVRVNEAACGVVFDQPVLDTLLLSAVLHPAQPTHRLEEIAARFGVPMVGRHTALGDAIVTAEVFVRMLPLLVAAGIRTLGEAREASRKTSYARLKY